MASSCVRWSIHQWVGCAPKSVTSLDKSGDAQEHKNLLSKQYWQRCPTPESPTTGRPRGTVQPHVNAVASSVVRWRCRWLLSCSLQASPHHTECSVLRPTSRNRESRRASEMRTVKWLSPISLTASESTSASW
jgi:hypothetical protein